MDGHECLVNHLLLRVFWLVHEGKDVTFFEAVEEFFDRLAWIPSLAPFVFILCLFSRAQRSIVGAEDVEDGARTVIDPRLASSPSIAFAAPW